MLNSIWKYELNMMHGTEMIANSIHSNWNVRIWCKSGESNMGNDSLYLFQFSSSGIQIIKMISFNSISCSVKNSCPAEYINIRSDAWNWNDSQFYTFKSELRVMPHLYIKFSKMIFWSQITVLNSFFTGCWTQFENIKSIWCMELEW